MDSLSDNIHPNDLYFINHLKDSISGNISDVSSTETEHVNILHNIIKGKRNGTINDMTKLFELISSDQIYVGAKYKLAVKLAQNFYIKSLEYNDTFLNNKNINYFIEKHLFYDYILGTLLSNPEYITYFNYVPDISHIKFYVASSKRLYERLNQFIQSNSGYITFKLKDFTIYTQYVKLMLDYLTVLPIERQYDLMDSLFNLCVELIYTIHGIVLQNRQYLQSLERISSYGTGYEINIIREELVNSTGELNNIFKQPLFMKLFTQRFKMSNIKCRHAPLYSTIISILPTFTYKWYTNYKEISYISRDMIEPFVCSFLADSKITIHDKVKLITESNPKIFTEKYSITRLVDIYNILEKYDETSGFYEQQITRKRIINIFLEYLYPTNNIYHPLNRENPAFCIDSIQLDNPIDTHLIPNPSCTKRCCDTSSHFYKYTQDHLQIFNELDNQTLSTFITLLMSELSEYIASLDIEMNGIFNQYINLSKKCKCCSIMDSIFKYYKFINCLLTDTCLRNNETINCKLTEIDYNIITRFHKMQLYKEVNRNTPNLFITSSTFVLYLKDFFRTFFHNIDNSLSQESYISNIVTNEELYNKEIFKKIINELYPVQKNNTDVSEVNDNTKMNNILNNYIKIIDNGILCKHAEQEQYNEDIPEKFLDPIQYTVLVTPIELPDTETIMEKSIILNHLIFNETNPFNGLKLTRKDLIEYNNKDDVMKRINDFKIDFNQWKSDHKL